MKSKTILLPGNTATETADLIAAGKADIGLGQAQVFIAVPGLQAVSFPSELQDAPDFLFFAGISTNAKDPAPA